MWDRRGRFPGWCVLRLGCSHVWGMQLPLTCPLLVREAGKLGKVLASRTCQDLWTKGSQYLLWWGWWRGWWDTSQSAGLTPKI